MNNETPSSNQNAATASTDTLDCPVLSSYIKCLNKDVLCVWRRVVNNNVTTKDTNSKHYTKQLWCFWFNNEPEWKQLIHKELTICEQSDYDHGLSYECRTLLFKAYHNLIEQSLISIGFCKLGKFFIFPVDNQQANSNSPFSRSAHQDNQHFSKLLQNTIQLVASSNRLAFSFKFFIHGENTVCCIIDVRLKNPIYKLTKSHFTNALHQQQPIDVILSPFGLSAVLTGHSSKETDSQVQKITNDWRKFFPFIQQASKPSSKPPTGNSTSLISSIAPLKLEKMDNLEDSFNTMTNKQLSNNQTNQLPTMVEVIVAGIKMKYPSNFVFMLQPNEHLATSKKRSIDNLCKLESSNSNKKSASSSLQKMDSHQETVQDLLFTSTHQFKDQNQPDRNLDFNLNFKVSPSQPQLPTVSYCIRSNLNQELNCAPPPPLNNHSTNDEQNDESFMQSFNKWDIYDVTCKLGCQCSRCKPKKSQKDQLKSSGNQPNKKLDKSNEKENKQGGNYQVKFNIPFHRRNFLVTNTYDLESSRCFAEVTNESNDKCALTNNNSINNNSQSTRLPNYFCKNANHLPPQPMKLTNNFQPDQTESDSSRMDVDHQQPNNKSTDNSTNQTKEKFEEEMFSPYSGDKSNTNSPNLSSVQWNTFQSSSAKENHKSDSSDKKSTYNETTSNDLIVVSNFNKNLFKQYTYRLGVIKKPQLPGVSHLNVDCNQSKGLLYDFNSVNNLNWELPVPKNKRLVKGLVNDESNLYLNNDDNFDDCDSSRDPYEFDDDCLKNSKKSSNDKAAGKSANNLDKKSDEQSNDKQQNLSNNKQSDNPLLNKVLTREEDITASYNVPDHMFASSGDESNDMFPVPDNYNSSTSKLNGKTTGNGNSNMLCDIAHMFPTPPSLEQNTAPSPYSFINSTDSALNEEYVTKEKLDSFYPMSPLDNIKEIASVYSTPLQTKFITSHKFSPLPCINVSNLKIPDECNYKSKLEKQKLKNNIGNNSALLSSAQQQSAATVNKQSSTNKTQSTNSKKLSGYTDVQSLINSSSSTLTNQFTSHNHLNVNKVNFDQIASMNSKPFSQSTSSSSSFMFSESKTQNLSSSNQFALVKKEPFDLTSHESTNYLNSNLPEINSLMANLVLSDSILNIFKDHNFDSCPLCICNMNIKGSDIDVYLPDNLMPNDEPQYKCSCGFSAIQNRYHSSYSGLFYEDEFEITTVCYDPLERLERRSLFGIDLTDSKALAFKDADNELRTKHDQFEPRIIDLLKSQCSVIFSSSSLLSKSLYFELFKKRTIESSEDESKMPILLNPKRIVSKRIFLQRNSALLRSDCCEITFLALMLGRQGLDGFPNKDILQQYNQIENVKKRKQDCIHEWIFDNGSIHSNNYEVVQFLKNMQTLLQETVQKKIKDLSNSSTNAKGKRS